MDHVTRGMPEYVSPGTREDPWRPECAQCDDTGWREVAYAKGELCWSQYQRRMVPAMYAHTVAIGCPCRATNRTYQRRHGRARA